MPSSSSNSITRYLEETVAGTIESGNPREYSLVSGSLNQSIESVESQELRSDRGRSDSTLVAGSVAGSLNIEWSHQAHDDFLEALLASAFVPVGVNGIATVADMAFDTASHSITSAATNLPLLEKGQWFKIAGAASPLNNGIYKASSATAPTTGAIVVDTVVKDIGLTAVAASCTISSSRLKQGNTTPLRTFTIERELSDVAKFFTWAGCYVNTLNLTFADKAVVSGNFGFIAQESEQQGSVSLFPGIATAFSIFGNPRFNSVTGAVVMIDGVSMADSCVTGFTLDVNAGLRERRCLGSGLAASSVGSDQFTVTGQSSIFFGSDSSSTLYGKKLQDLPLSFSICVTDSAGNGFAITIPRAKITDGTVDAGGLGSDVMMTLNTSASTDATTGTMLIIDRLGAIV